MEMRRLREIADRCRELSRIAVRDEVRQQLRLWAEEFEAETNGEPDTTREHAERI
jgi:hypothetical protein